MFLGRIIQTGQHPYATVYFQLSTGKIVSFKVNLDFYDYRETILALSRKYGLGVKSIPNHDKNDEIKDN